MKIFLFALLLGSSLALAQECGHSNLPQRLTAQLCIERSQTEGMMIANMRWRIHRPYESVKSIGFCEDLPQWFVRLVDEWIDSAYAWQGDPQDWLTYIAAQCGADS